MAYVPASFNGLNQANFGLAGKFNNNTQTSGLGLVTAGFLFISPWEPCTSGTTTGWTACSFGTTSTWTLCSFGTTTGWTLCG